MDEKTLVELLHKIATCAKCNDEGGGQKAHREVIAMFARAIAPTEGAVDLPERVIDVLFQSAGVSTYHPDGDQREKLYAFARAVVAETLARLPDPSPEAPAVDALTTGAGADPMDVLLERLKSGGDYTAPLYTAKQGNEPKVFMREQLAILVDQHKAHDGSVDSFELADSFIALLANPET